jgi:hypothetical protein
MSMNVADSVLAATHKLVQQAMTGQWHEVPKTVEERRVLLDRLSASASPADQSWLSALRQAMAESDAAVAKMAGANAPTPTQQGNAPTLTLPHQTGEGTDAAQVDGLMDMIRGERL